MSLKPSLVPDVPELTALAYLGASLLQAGQPAAAEPVLREGLTMRWTPETGSPAFYVIGTF